MSDASEAAANAVLGQFMAAFNAQNEEQLRRSMNFPHFRIGTTATRYFDTAEDFTLAGFQKAVSGDDWKYSDWDYRHVVQAGDAKVHMNVQFTRYRSDDSVIGHYPSLWVVTNQNGHWGIQVRSSFAP